jgi:LDH2 family malate/lactate/ureidoglycolate dehydrogenase
MNLPPGDSERIQAGRLREFSADCLKAAGMTPDYAEQLATLLTDGDLRGVRSHGTRQLRGYCRSLREERVNPSPDIRVVKETDTAVLVDGDGGLGYAPMMMATDRAIEKARDRGLAAGAVCHVGHYGSAGHYVRRAMEQGCFAFSVQGAHPAFEEVGDQRRPSAYWGNPPMCFGLPSQDEPPLVLDGGTTLMADYQGEELQELIPAAFFKSIGFTAVSTALGGAFVGMNNPRAAEITGRWPAAGSGGLILVIDIALFAPPREFREGVDHLVRGVRETMAPVRGYDEATVPGTMEYRKEHQYRHEGIPIGLEDLELLNQTAMELDLPPLT